MRTYLIVMAATLALGAFTPATATPLAAGASAIRAESEIELAKWGHGRHAWRHYGWCRGPNGRYRCKYEDYHQHWR